MFRNYPELKTALELGARQYRKKYFSTSSFLVLAKHASIFAKHVSKQTKEQLYLSKVEEYVRQLGNNELGLLMLAYAVMTDGHGSTKLCKCLCDAIIANKIFEEFEIRMRHAWSDQLIAGSGFSPFTSRSFSDTKIEVVISMIYDALQARRDLFSNIETRISSIQHELNNPKQKITGISLDYFSREMMQLDAQRP